MFESIGDLAMEIGGVFVLGRRFDGQMNASMVRYTLVVFSGFAVAYLGEKLRWNYFAAFVCIVGAVMFTF